MMASKGGHLRGYMKPHETGGTVAAAFRTMQESPRQSDDRARQLELFPSPTRQRLFEEEP
jgi:hypothetical protein